MRDPRPRLWPLLLLLLGATPPAGAAPSVFVPNHGDGTVSVIDAATNTVAATVPVGADPLGTAIDPQGGSAYVTNQVAAGTVSIIDAASSTVAATVAVGSGPSGIALKLPGTKLYVANRDDKTVSVLDVASARVVATIPVGKNPLGVAVNPAGTPAYVVNKGSDSVSVIDTNSDAVIATVDVGNDPTHVAVSPSGHRVYVSNGSNSSVSVIDAGTNAVVATVAVGNSPEGVAFDPTGARAYVANNGPGTVSVIDAATDTVVATVDVGTSPFGLAVEPGGARVYVTNRGGADVSVIDTATSAVVATVDVGFAPAGYGQLVRPALEPPVLGKTARACQAEIAARGRKLASLEQAQQAACLNGLLAAAATGPQQAEAACAQGRAGLASARAAAGGTIARKCAGLAPSAIHSPCDRAAATIGRTAECILDQHAARVSQMVGAAYGVGGPPSVGKAARACQKAIGARAGKAAAVEHAQLGACLNSLLAAAAKGSGMVRAVGRCYRALDAADAGSSLARARAAAGTRMLEKCQGVTPPDIGSPCDGGATTMEGVVSCILDQHAGRVQRMIAAEFNDACPMLTGIGLGRAFPGVCAGP